MMKLVPLFIAYFILRRMLPMLGPTRPARGVISVTIHLPVVVTAMWRSSLPNPIPDPYALSAMVTVRRRTFAPLTLGAVLSPFRLWNIARSPLDAEFATNNIVSRSGGLPTARTSRLNPGALWLKLSSSLVLPPTPTSGSCLA